MIYSFSTDDTHLNTAVSVEPSYAWKKVISVLNTKKGMNYYELRCDKDHHSPEEINKFISKVIESKAVKEHLKRVVGLADRAGYSFGSVKRRKGEKQMTAAEATPLSHPGTILNPGVMHKRNIHSHTTSVQSLGRHVNNSNDDSISDDGSNYKKTFLEGGQLIE
eukprot:14502822-Ditylum_brightwellii.AAC.1